MPCRHRDFHAEADKEQCHKKIADTRDLGHDVERVRERGNHHPGDERAHRRGQTEPAGKTGHRQTPGQCADQHQFRQARDGSEYRRQHKPAGHKRDGHEQQHLAQGQRQQPDRGIFQVRLEGEEQDDEQVLQHQHAQCDAPDERFEFAFVVEDFDDDDRAAHGRGHAEVKRLQPVSARPTQSNTSQPSSTQPRICTSGGNRDDPARAQHFFEVNLQPDHEQQQRQADFGNGPDVLGIGDPLETVRTDDESGNEVGQQHRLARHLRHHRQDPRGNDADGDVTDEALLHAGASLNEEPQHRRETVLARNGDVCRGGPRQSDSIRTSPDTDRQTVQSILFLCRSRRRGKIAGVPYE